MASTYCVDASNCPVPSFPLTGFIIAWWGGFIITLNPKIRELNVEGVKSYTLSLSVSKRQSWDQSPGLSTYTPSFLSQYKIVSRKFPQDNLRPDAQILLTIFLSKDHRASTETIVKMGNSLFPEALIASWVKFSSLSHCVSWTATDSLGY